MVDFDSTKLNIQNPELSTTTPTDSGEVSAPKKQEKPTLKYIFEQQMTRQQVADEFGQIGLDMFDKANTDEKDGISEDEYNAALNEGKVDNSNSSDYTVKKGDTLSKIAKQHNITLEELVVANPEITNPNLIKIGQKIKIPQNTQHQQELKKKNENGTVPRLLKGNMTLEQAKKLDKTVPGTLELFKKYANGADIISDEGYLNYIKDIKANKNNKFDEQARQQFLNSNSTLQLQILKEKVEPYIDKELISDEMSVKDLVKKLNQKLPEKDRFSEEEFRNASNEQRGKILADAETKLLRKEMEQDSPEFKAQYERLKQGKFTKHEIQELNLVEGINLSDEQLKEYASMAILRKHITAVAATTYKAGNEKDDDAIMSLLHGFQKGMLENKDDPDVRFILAAIGVKSLSDSNKQQEGAAVLAKMATDSAEVLNNDTSFIITESVLRHASSDVIQDFISNNPAYMDTVKEVINLLPDGELKTNLSDIVNTTNNQEYISGGSDKSRAGNNNVNWSSNPMTQNVYDTRQASNELYQDKGVVDYSTNEQAAHISANKIGTELGLPEQIRYNPDRVQKLIKDINNSVDEFDKLTPKEQQKISNYFTAAKPSTIVSIMISAKPKVQQFLLSYISTEAIAKNIKKDDIKNLIGTIQESLAEHTKLNVQAGIRKIEQMTDAEKYMYELNEKFN